MAITQQDREAEIITPLGKDVLLLQDMTVSEELGRLFTIDAEVLSKENISFEYLLGQNVSIRINLEEGKRFFNGYVSGMSQAVDEGHYARYNITLKPWFWFLTRTSDCKIFQNQTVPDIIKQVCNGLGFTDIEDKLTASYRTWGYCVQYRETDFNFLSRLMEQEGIYYYFTHEEGKHTLNLADGYGSHEPISGYEELEYFPPDDVVVRKDDKRVEGWFVSKKIQPGAYVLTDYDFVKPKADLKVNSTVTKGHSEADHEIFDYPGEYVESSDGNNYARARIEELQTQYEQIQGQGKAKGLTSGGLFTLANYPREDQNKEYLVVSVTHNISMDDFESGGSSGGASYRNNFTVSDSGIPYRTSRITPKPIVQGLQTAVVVGSGGEEIYTDEHGRVKLQFHWDRYGESNENSSCWIRVSQVHAGKGFGGIDIPRIGEEVLVSFEEGDPDRPLVTGRVYNGDNKAPNGLPAKKMVSGMKSNTTPGGGGDNTIMLDDTKGNEAITIHGQYNMNTTVDHDQTDVIHNDRTITVEGTHTETITKDTTIKITEGNLKHDVDAGTATYKVKGAVSETFDNKQETTVADEIIITSTGSKVHITAATEIQLQTGASTLLMKSDGTIKLDGVDVSINGVTINIHGISVTSMADADHNTKGATVISNGTATNAVKGGMVMLN